MGAILVIKHGAFGDVVMALGAFRAIREHHAGDRLTVLTTPPFASLLRMSGLFDDVWEDSRPRLWLPAAWLGLRAGLAGGGFAKVYDLQTSARTAWYFRMLPRPKPEWSGIAPGCSHPDLDPERRLVHGSVRLARQLAQAGIDHTPPSDVEFLQADIGHLALPRRIALLVPGGASHRPKKRWPAERYAALARRLVDRELTPVLIGTAAEADVLAAIKVVCPGAMDLGGRTDFAQLATIARHAAMAIGNDTGPMHLIAAAGCPVLTLFSGVSNPVRAAPGGPDAAWLQHEPLAALDVARVLERLPRPA